MEEATKASVRQSHRLLDGTETLGLDPSSKSLISSAAKDDAAKLKR